ncbi:MAG: hypothetical protein ACI3T9_03830 [Romboutsia timonensis]
MNKYLVEIVFETHSGKNINTYYVDSIYSMDVFKDSLFNKGLMKDDVSNRSYYFNLNKIFNITVDKITADTAEMKLEEETLNG